MYNVRFDSDRPPQTTNATIGFFKTGAPITIQVAGPTAPNVSVAGRVMTPTGMGVRGATVTIADSIGGTRTTYTGSFGYYSFDNIVPGGMYTISVAAKRYTFTPQTLQINDNLTNVDFVSAP
jgi:hypothetical protein